MPKWSRMPGEMLEIEIYQFIKRYGTFFFFHFLTWYNFKHVRGQRKIKNIYFRIVFGSHTGIKGMYNCIEFEETD